MPELLQEPYLADEIYIVVVRNGVTQRVDIDCTSTCTIDAKRLHPFDPRWRTTVKLFGYLLPTPAVRKPDMSDKLIFGASACPSR